MTILPAEGVTRRLQCNVHCHGLVEFHALSDVSDLRQTESREIPKLLVNPKPSSLPLSRLLSASCAHGSAGLCLQPAYPRRGSCSRRVISNVSRAFTCTCEYKSQCRVSAHRSSCSEWMHLRSAYLQRSQAESLRSGCCELEHGRDREQIAIRMQLLGVLATGE